MRACLILHRCIPQGSSLCCEAFFAATSSICRCVCVRACVRACVSMCEGQVRASERVRACMQIIAKDLSQVIHHRCVYVCMRERERESGGWVGVKGHYRIETMFLSNEVGGGGGHALGEREGCACVREEQKLF
jgi:hypothetical protein